jgi:hypothetical protein
LKRRRLNRSRFVTRFERPWLVAAGKLLIDDRPLDHGPLGGRLASDLLPNAVVVLPIGPAAEGANRHGDEDGIGKQGQGEGR